MEEDGWQIVGHLFGKNLRLHLFYEMYQWVQGARGNLARDREQARQDVVTITNTEFDSETWAVSLSTWDSYKEGWIPRTRLQQLARRATFVGPLATIIGR